MKVLGLGLALTAFVTAVEWIAWGGSTVVASVSFGVLATGIELVAVRGLKPALAGPYADLVKHFAVGMGLRSGGIVVFVIAVVADRVLFPPVPSAFGYLGVVVPLLLAETRLAR